MRDLDRLAEAGQKKLQANTRRDLVASEVVDLIKSSSLNGSDELIELISKVYAIGFEEGYRARQSQTQSKRRLTV